MKAIFNSLGSNYDKWFWAKALFCVSNNDEQSKLKQLLEGRYHGTTLLFYKGREAILAALQLSKLPRVSKVAITGFTCYAVYRAVIDAGHQPVFVDLAPESLNYDNAALNKQLSKHPDIKAIIIQNTLGYTCNIEPIISTAKKHNLIVIEDLAHSIGSTYPDGQKAGTLGDFTAMSFSQDKVVDGISGGALIIRNKKYIDDVSKLTYAPLGLMQRLRDRFYPVLTCAVRSTYHIGLGKILHAIFKKLHLLSRSVDGVFGVLRPLPKWYCRNILRQFDHQEQIISHRIETAKIYKDILPKDVCVEYDSPSTYLRFPVAVSNREGLFEYLEKLSIHISDTWYDVPVAPKRYFNKTSYKTGDCPNSDKLTSCLVNLPTHINISKQQAIRIAEGVSKWLSK